ncbi:methylaspartate mutase subunit E [Desulfosporosinus sp.]|uniref:methylaspartate mutase subunit E n=1 Tax=Desulfosporosinus sp. TaxID=157907 RepID=UPI0025B9A1E6|nr:methylaspartate mutase subunit E [Desulfosporosinus sp.]MBC2727984.1 methylaspartate mutase subunit E [Desulfosporosinus sp.]
MINKRLEAVEFHAQQEKVLTQWSTGEGINFEEAVSYHKALPREKVFAQVLAKAKAEGRTLAQPRAGVALIDEHIDMLKYLQEEGGADLLPTTIDSLTRQNRYQEAEKGISEGKIAGHSMLTGFPAINYGVVACRKVIESVNLPCQVRHGTSDARLLAEITLAGGFTDFEGGGISSNIPYAKNVSLEETISNWQYVDRLVGLYEEQGVRINREPFGPLTGTLVPPCISHSVAVIEALLAAEQGVKNISLGYGQCGNLIQDIAAIRSLIELGEEFLGRFNYQDIMLTSVFHQWMGGFPQDESKAFGVISWGAATAAFAKATKVIVKSPYEAIGISTKEANASGIKATKQVLSMLKDQIFPNTPELQWEEELIKQETRAIVNKVLELGDGDLAIGTVKGFEAGVIDIPFAPSRFNAGRILPVRDSQGAVRLLDHGNLPLGKESLDFHRERITERGKEEGREPSFQMVVDDIYAIGKGRLIGRPR